MGATIGGWQPCARSAVFSEAELEGLPDPVRRYLGAAIAPGTPLATSAWLRMRGQIKVGRWLPFRARETLDPHHGFTWTARAAEAIWVPTALLPRFGVDLVSRRRAPHHRALPDRHRPGRGPLRARRRRARPVGGVRPLGRTQGRHGPLGSAPVRWRDQLVRHLRRPVDPKRRSVRMVLRERPLEPGRVLPLPDHRAASWVSPMMLPSGSFTAAISLPPPTSRTSSSVSAPAARSCSSVALMSSTVQ
jgi:hypothetical protein